MLVLRLLSTGSCAVKSCRPHLYATPVGHSFAGSSGRTFSRQYASQAREGFVRRSARRSLKDAVVAPAGEQAATLGKTAVACASAAGIGALCYYGLGLSSEAGAIDRAVIWPQYVKQRIKDTYMYFGGSILLTAGSAVAVFRSPTLINLASKNSLLATGVTLVALIGSGIAVRSMPYREGFGAKQLAWAGHSALLGAIIAPLCFIGGPLILRAACYTGGIVGGLSAVAVCAPSEKFLNMGGPLAIGLGAVFAASLGSMFLSPATALGAGLYSISLYGGLVLFSGFLLYDTQNIIKKSEVMALYDPINESMSIYMDTINIFIRIASILAGGGNRRK